jgi:trans-aconitate methyltransferase
MPECHALLTRGCRVLDVGCGLGASSQALRKGYPNSTVVGVDPDDESIAQVRLDKRAMPHLHRAQWLSESYPV